MIGNVEVWTKPDCPYCVKAKQLLSLKNIPFSELKLNEDFTREILLEKFPNAKSYPVIVIDGFHIGWFSQLNEKLIEEFSDTRKLLNEG
jgi:glutaredoxin 3